MDGGVASASYPALFGHSLPRLPFDLNHGGLPLKGAYVPRPREWEDEVS